MTTETQEHSEPGDRPDASPAFGGPLRRWEIVLWVLTLLGIGLTRYPTMGHALTEAHGFRQAQTAFQTVGFHRYGIDMLRPLVPVFGDPWTIPFEFPLFQAVASVPMAFGVSADLANRGAGLAFFVVTALLLWFLVRKIANSVVAATALFVFSFSPFALVWSRASMIEYFATAAALGWVIAAIRWRDTRRNVWLIVAIVVGMIATTVKVTTALPWVVPILLYQPDHDADVSFFSKQWWKERLNPGFLAVLIVPAIALTMWTRHADAIKAASIATEGLTSTGLRSWNFGTLAQRTDVPSLLQILRPIDSLIVGPGWLVLAILVPILAKRHRAFWIGIALVPLVAIGTFFNLYFRHDYYLAAVSPALAALLACGIYLVVSKFVDDERIRNWIIAVVVAVWLLLVLTSTTYWHRAYSDSGVPIQSQEIAALTAEDDRVLIVGGDWDPRFLYYADRWGMMVTEFRPTKEIMESQSDLDSYTTLVSVGQSAPGIEHAAIWPWYAPVSSRTLFLGDSYDEVTSRPTGWHQATPSVELAASIGESGPVEAASDLRMLELATYSLDCGLEQTVEIPEGEGVAWLLISVAGSAQPIMRPDIVAVPSVTRSLFWMPPAGSTVRPIEVLGCVGEGSLTIDLAGQTSE